MVTPEHLRYGLEKEGSGGFKAFTPDQIADRAIAEDSVLGQKMNRFMRAGVTKQQALNYFAYGSTHGKEPEPKRGNFFERIGEDVKQRSANVGKALERKAEGKQGMIKTGIQGAGEAFGLAFGDAPFQAAQSVGATLGPDVLMGASEAFRTGGVVPDSMDTGEILSAGMGKMGIDEAAGDVASSVAEKYAVWKQEHPEDAETIEAILEIGSSLPMGALLGKGLQATKGGLGMAKDMVKHSIPSFKPRNPDALLGEVDDVVGAIVQGDAGGIKKGKDALSLIDASGVETYDDLGSVLGSKLDAIGTKQDEILESVVGRKTLQSFNKFSKAGNASAVSNSVRNSFDHLEELYKTTGQADELVRIRNLRDIASKEGLSAKQINDLAREYGQEFGDKAFSKRTGDALTSVNAELYENTRKGIKNAARSMLPDKTSEMLDDAMSSLIETRRLVGKMAEKVQLLSNKVQARGLLEKIGRLAGRSVDAVSLHSLRGFLSSMFPSNVGLKTMNSLQIQDALGRNLGKLNKLLKEIGSLSDDSAAKRINELLTPPDPFLTPLTLPRNGASQFGENRMAGIDGGKDMAQTLREARGLGAGDIMAKHPDIQLKRDVPAQDIYGNKVTIPDGEVLTPYELKGNKIMLQDGETYIVSKNQYQNIKGNSISGEVKEFAPELKGVEETVRGGNTLPEGTTLRENVVGPYQDYKYSLLDKDGNVLMEANQKSTIYEDAPPVKTKYGRDNLVLPGGENYKEVLIKAPIGKETLKNAKGEVILEKSGGKVNDVFKSSHWEEPNVISHLRLNDRTYKGKKVTFMEEIQSDWAREGRSKGFSGEKGRKAFDDYVDTLREKYNTDALVMDTKKLTPTELSKYQQLFDSIQDFGEGVPNHPLLKNWQELSIKRALKEAVDSDSEYLSWISGEQTSARYNLATKVDNVEWKITKQSKGDVKVVNLKPKEGQPISINIGEKGEVLNGYKVPEGWKGKKLDEVLGKGLADKIMEKETGTLAGEGLKFGGEWANNLYDKQVKNIVEDLTGKKVEVIDMGLPIDGKVDVWYDTKGTRLTPDNLKVGKKVGTESRMDMMNDEPNSYVITDVLGDGKFKAVEFSSVHDKATGRLGRSMEINGEKKWVETIDAETFDISQKTTPQQAIRITPEIRNRVLGKSSIAK